MTTDRRILDRDHEAHALPLNGGWEVRAGDTRVGARDQWHAQVIAAHHNDCRANAEYARAQRKAIA